LDSRSWPCPTCDDVTIFVQPPCADGHTDDGGECPEWICADCGTAIVAGGLAAPAGAVRERVAA
jgi:hypothetical protein